MSIKSFPDYKHLLQENYVEYKHIFFNVTQLKKFFYNTLVKMVKKYVSIPRNFLVINVIRERLYAHPVHFATFPFPKLMFLKVIFFPLSSMPTGILWLP